MSAAGYCEKCGAFVCICGRESPSGEPVRVPEPAQPEQVVTRHQLNEYTVCVRCKRFDPAGPCPGEPAQPEGRVAELEQRLARIAELAHDRDEDSHEARSERLGQCAAVAFWQSNREADRDVLKWSGLAAQLAEAESALATERDKVKALEAQPVTRQRFIDWFHTLDMQQRIEVWWDCDAQTAAEVREALAEVQGKVKALEAEVGRGGDIVAKLMAAVRLAPDQLENAMQQAEVFLASVDRDQSPDPRELERAALYQLIDAQRVWVESAQSQLPYDPVDFVAVHEAQRKLDALGIDKPALPSPPLSGGKAMPVAEQPKNYDMIDGDEHSLVEPQTRCAHLTTTLGETFVCPLPPGHAGPHEASVEDVREKFGKLYPQPTAIAEQAGKCPYLFCSLGGGHNGPCNVDGGPPTITTVVTAGVSPVGFAEQAGQGTKRDRCPSCFALSQVFVLTADGERCPDGWHVGQGEKDSVPSREAPGSDDVPPSRGEIGGPSGAGEPDEARQFCPSCPHPRHAGICTAHSDQTAYICACATTSFRTTPTPHNVAPEPAEKLQGGEAPDYEPRAASEYICEVIMLSPKDDPLWVAMRGALRCLDQEREREREELVEAIKHAERTGGSIAQVMYALADRLERGGR